MTNESIDGSHSCRPDSGGEDSRRTHSADLGGLRAGPQRPGNTRGRDDTMAHDQDNAARVAPKRAAAPPQRVLERTHRIPQVLQPLSPEAALTMRPVLQPTWGSARQPGPLLVVIALRSATDREPRFASDTWRPAHAPGGYIAALSDSTSGIGSFRRVATLGRARRRDSRTCGAGRQAEQRGGGAGGDPSR